jgi:nucleoside-diphosphate-sugar epimerase
VHGSVSTSPADETAPLDPRDNYQRSKVLAEEACREAMGGEMEIIILRPCGIYGPGDLRMLKMFKMLQRRTFVQVGAGKANFHPVFIDDLVEGFMLGMTVDDIDGETFIIGGPDYLPLAEFIATAASALSAPKPWIHVPYGAMEAAARLCEAVCSPIGLQPPLHRRRLTFFKHNRAFSIDKACQRLGYAPKVRLPEGFAKTVQWYRQEKLLA